jgi:hypothetical protein
VSPVCSIVLSGGEEKGWVKFWPPRSARDVHPFTRKNTSKHFSRKFFENYLYANVKNFAPNYYTYWAPLLLRSPMMAEAHTWCVLAAMSVSATCTASRPHPTWPDQPSVRLLFGFGKTGSGPIPGSGATLLLLPRAQCEIFTAMHVRLGTPFNICCVPSVHSPIFNKPCGCALRVNLACFHNKKKAPQ